MRSGNTTLDFMVERLCQRTNAKFELTWTRVGKSSRNYVLVVSRPDLAHGAGMSFPLGSSRAAARQIAMLDDIFFRMGVCQNSAG